MNKIQSEEQLEKNLIQRLVGLGYDRVTILNNDDSCANLKKQLEKHNLTLNMDRIILIYR